MPVFRRTLFGLDHPAQTLPGAGARHLRRYDLPCVTIESVLPLDGGRLIITNDNNFPAVGGRATDRRDDTEFILLQVEFDAPSP